MPQIAKWMNFQSGRRGEAEASKRLHRRSKHHPIPLRHFATLLPLLTGDFFRVVIALCQFSKGATAQATPVKIASTMTIGWDASAVFQLLFCRRSLNACEPVCLGLTGIRISCSVVSTVLWLAIGNIRHNARDSWASRNHRREKCSTRRCLCPSTFLSNGDRVDPHQTSILRPSLCSFSDQQD